jgi:hypothetical protein
MHFLSKSCVAPIQGLKFPTPLPAEGPLFSSWLFNIPLLSLSLSLSHTHTHTHSLSLSQCLKKRFITFKSLYKFIQVLNCHNVAKHTEFYLGYLRFIVTFTGNAGCFKRSFTMVFKILLCGECYENVYT